MPSFHVTVPAQFETIKLADCPEQMVGLLTLGAGVGIDVTVTVLVAVPVLAQLPELTVQVAV